MNVAEYLVQTLVKQQIKTVFGYQGGNITYLIDAIGNSDDITYMQNYNEQGAAFAANSYAQVSENFGVAVSSSGPGAINMINGIANAYYDSIPCLYITGNINTNSMRENDRFRQNGFQETDIVNLVKGITKYAITIKNAEETTAVLKHALHVMKTGRPGPVLLDIPHNIQRTMLENTEDISEEDNQMQRILKEQLENVFQTLEQAKKPVILLGGGARSKKVKELLLKLLTQMPIPVVASLCGIDVISNKHDCYRGMIGSYGLPHANRTLHEADWVMVLGSRMDERQRSVGVEEFLQDAVVLHVDVDENELGHVKKNEICMQMSVSQFLTAILEHMKSESDYHSWLDTTRAWMEEAVPEENLIYGSGFQKRLTSLLGNEIADSIVCVDVGNHQMAAAQALKICENARYLNSGGLGSMGYALPAAIGAYYAAPDKTIICITGDGGIMMNIQELQVITREKLPVIIVVVNNNGLGMIASYQNLAFEGRNYGSVWGYSAPNFEQIAQAFQLEYVKIGKDCMVSLKNDRNQILIEIEV